ncbi:hypothetical protein ABK040_007722 [Willaertia magna]
MEALAAINVSEEVLQEYKKLKLSQSKTNNALILKIDKETDTIVMDEKLEATTFEDLQELLDECNLQPRFIVLSYVWARGDRTQYPLVFIFYTPKHANPYDMMIYSRSKLPLIKKLDATRSYEIRDYEELTEEWLLEQLNKK